MVLKNKWALASIGLLCWAIAASLLSAYYYYQYTDLATRVGEVPINLGIDYGNGTRVWYNGTLARTIYDAMRKAGWNIKSTDYGPMGIYINAINGVEESPSDYRYWGWWSWTAYGWSHGGTACNKYVVSSGEIILWHYSKVDPTTFEYSPPP